MVELVISLGCLIMHTKSLFWNAIIPWTSHDDLTEKSLNSTILKAVEKIWEIKSPNKVTSMIWQIFFARNFTEEALLKKCLQNLEINLEDKRMAESFQFFHFKHTS